MLRLYDYTCKYCKKAFKSRNRDRQYCCQRCAYDDRIGKPRHPNSGKKRTKKPTKFICQRCGEPFERMVYPSLHKKCSFEFCGPACRNKARRLKPKPCPVCGKMFSPQVVDMGGVRRQHCSQECANLARTGIPSPRRTPKEVSEAVAKIYPSQGPEPLMKMFNMSRKAICVIAHKQGVTLNPEVYYERVHGAAREFMTNDNPMKRPEVVKKVTKWQKKHRAEMDEKLAAARSKVQRKKPTGLERRLHRILKSFKVDFEVAAVIKPKFVVDVRIRDLIIQADGDYWHGHPSREPLTKRQKAQQRRDKAQDKYLTACGYTVVRIWESDMSHKTVASILKDHGII
jgi:G:T-mismatch repair DNA endonuclease (very short patch repair protein)